MKLQSLRFVILHETCNPCHFLRQAQKLSDGQCAKPRGAIFQDYFVILIELHVENVKASNLSLTGISDYIDRISKGINLAFFISKNLQKRAFDVFRNEKSSSKQKF